MGHDRVQGEQGDLGSRPEDMPNASDPVPNRDKGAQSSTTRDLVLFGILAGGAAFLSLILVWVMTVMRSRGR